MLEKEIQREVFKWVILSYKEYPQLRMMFSTQNGLKSNGFSVNQAKLTGLKNGVPDIILPVPNVHYHSLWIELKKIDGKVTSEQKEYISLLNQYGNYATACWGYDQTIDTITKYLNNFNFGESK